MKRTTILLILILSLFQSYSRDMKFIRDFDNDKINDYLILRRNKVKENFDRVEISLSRHGKYEFNVNTGIEYLREIREVTQSENDWEEMTFDYFCGLKKNGVQYLFFSETNSDSVLGVKTFLRIDSLECNIVFSKPFEISKILAKDNSVTVIGRNEIQNCKRDTIIDNRKYSICEYNPFLCYKLSKKDLIDYEMTVPYNLNHYVGWAVSERRKVIKDKSTQKEKFLFETYRKYPETSLKYLSKKDLLAYTKEELRFIRNEIFADYGYVFSTDLLDWHFSQFDWYVKEDKDVNKDLSCIEKENIRLIKSIEDE